MFKIFMKDVRRFGLNTTTPDGEDLINFGKKIIQIYDGLNEIEVLSKDGKGEDSFLNLLKKF